MCGETGRACVRGCGLKTCRVCSCWPGFLCLSRAALPCFGSAIAPSNSRVEFSLRWHSSRSLSMRFCAWQRRLIFSAQSRLDFVVGRIRRSAVPAIGRPAGTALRLARPTSSRPHPPRADGESDGWLNTPRFSTAQDPIRLAWVCFL